MLTVLGYIGRYIDIEKLQSWSSLVLSTRQTSARSLPAFSLIPTASVHRLRPRWPCSDVPPWLGSRTLCMTRRVVRRRRRSARRQLPGEEGLSGRQMGPRCDGDKSTLARRWAAVTAGCHADDNNSMSEQTAAFAQEPCGSHDCRCSKWWSWLMNWASQAGCWLLTTVQQQISTQRSTMYIRVLQWNTRLTSPIWHWCYSDLSKETAAAQRKQFSTVRSN